MKKFLFILLFLLAPIAVSANGGDQRIIDGGKYFINLSRAPFTPMVGVPTAMLPSFFDVEKNKLVAEDLIVRVQIARLGGAGSEKRTFVFEKDNIFVRGGVLEGLSYTFAEPGLHEIFFDFVFASNPEKVYKAPDFLIDVQEPEIPVMDDVLILIAIISAVIGGMVGWMIGRRKMYPCKECGYRYESKK